MCACVNKNLGLSSSLKMEEEEAIVTKKQGIVSILGSDSDNSSKQSAVYSLRRTLSADMSSKKWLSQNGFLSPMKKISSSTEFSKSEINSSSSSEEEDEEEEYGGGGEKDSRLRFDIWVSTQEEKNKNFKDIEKNGQFDVWSSILSQKPQEDNKPLPLPYVHPLAKRSASSLSKKSLEICTESLGSETGSESFSSYPPSEIGDVGEDKEGNGNIEDQQEPQQKQEDCPLRQEEPIKAVKNSYLGGKKPTQRSFPPPIPSLSRQDGVSTYIKTRRDNGRLVLEAVSVPSKNNFQAQRQNGRLVLTFTESNENNDQVGGTNQEISDEREEEKEREVVDEENECSEEESEEEEEEEEKKKMGLVMERTPKFSSGLMRFHRLALVVNKPLGLANRNPTWPKNFNEMIKLEDEEVLVVEKTKLSMSLSKSLPPRPPPPPQTSAATATFNAYEYYWRSKSKSKSYLLNNSSTKSNSYTNNRFVLTKNLMKDEKQQKLVVMRRNKVEGGGDELVVPLLSKGCKEQRRSLLFLKPYCIATS